MILEPFELKGKVIKDCYYKNNELDLVIEFEDGNKIIVGTWEGEDEINGNSIRDPHIIICNTL